MSDRTISPRPNLYTLKVLSDCPEGYAARGVPFDGSARNCDGGQACLQHRPDAVEGYELLGFHTEM